MSTSRGIGPTRHFDDPSPAVSSFQTPLSPCSAAVRRTCARERERVPAPVVVAAGGQRRVAAAGDQRRTGRRRHAGLVAEQQHEDVAARIDASARRRSRTSSRSRRPRSRPPRRRSGPRPRAPVGARRRPRRRAGRTRMRARAEDVVEQRRVPERQQLLGLPEARRAAGGENEPANSRWHAPRRSVGAAALAAEVHALAADVEVSASPRRRTSIPQTGSTAAGVRHRPARRRGRGPSARRRSRRGSRSRCPPGARAPMSSPAGRVDLRAQRLGDVERSRAPRRRAPCSPPGRRSRRPPPARRAQRASSSSPCEATISAASDACGSIAPPRPTS